MAPLVDAAGNALGSKAAGQLIKSDDWNRLVAEVERLNNVFGSRIQALEDRVTQGFNTISDRLGDIDDSLLDIGNKLAGLQGVFAQFYRVNLSTTRSNYAIGEGARITARLTDLLGNPVSFPNPASRPFIDLIAVSGRLKPADGSTALTGVDERTISVQTNERGVAEVILRSEQVQGFPIANEAEIESVLSNTINGASLSSIILQSPTTMAPSLSDAFGVFTREYDRDDGFSFRTFADNYYTKNQNLVTGNLTPDLHDDFRHRWHDYRVTVMAFVKMDNNPVTPDYARGASSIQVTFRDWVTPWIVLDYTNPIKFTPLVSDYRDRFTPRFSNDFSRTVTGINNEVDVSVRDLGLLGKIRAYQAIDKALDTLTFASPPTFFGDVVQNFRNAANFQRTLAPTEFNSISGSVQNLAFQFVTSNATRSSTAGPTTGPDLSGQVSVLGTRIDSLDRQVNNPSTGLSALNQQIIVTNRDISNISNSLPGLQNAISTLPSLEGKVRDLQTNVGTIRTTDLPGIQTNIDQIRTQVQNLPSGGDLPQRFNTLNSRIDQLDANFQVMNLQVSELSTHLGDIRTNVTEVGSQVSGLSNSFGTLRNKVDSTLSESGPITKLQSSVQTISEQVQGLRGLNVSEINSKLSTVSALENRISKLEKAPGGRSTV